jgi:tRNA threonylcarbamoyladenosine biosynthesis protein TsaE
LVILETRDEAWNNEADCATSAARLAAQPCLRQAIVELNGDLGAGKTTFARNLLRALGITGTIKSPTYAIMESYATPASEQGPSAGAPISHFDFYRFNDPQEWEDAGFRDIFAAPGLKLIEWPEKAHGLLPTPDLQLTLESLGDDRRRVRWDAMTPLGVRLLPASKP